MSRVPQAVERQPPRADRAAAVLPAFGRLTRTLTITSKLDGSELRMV
jgi:hypothetical protein